MSPSSFFFFAILVSLSCFFLVKRVKVDNGSYQGKHNVKVFLWCHKTPVGCVDVGSSERQNFNLWLLKGKWLFTALQVFKREMERAVGNNSTKIISNYCIVTSTEVRRNRYHTHLMFCYITKFLSGKIPEAKSSNSQSYWWKKTCVGLLLTMLSGNMSSIQIKSEAS